MTGQKAADEMTRADMIVTGCKNEWLQGVVDDILTTSESWVHFLKQLQSAFPHFETDASIRGALERVQKLTSLVIELTIRMSETEKLLLLTQKIQKKTGTERRSPVERRAKTYTYKDLADLLEELALERISAQHVEGEREAQLNFLKGG